MKSGVYLIRNLVTGNIYVGSTSNVASRRASHLYDLRHHSNKIPLLQKDYDTFGENVFEFKVLALVPTYMLQEIEQMLIDNFRPQYNTNEKAGKYIGGYVRTPEAIRKRSETMKNIKWSEESIEKRRKGLLEHYKTHKKIVSPETKKKISLSLSKESNPNRGKHRSEDTKRKISVAVSKIYRGFISPDGIIYSPVTKLQEFCTIHDLGLSSMVAVAHGKRKHHKGWKRFE